MSATLTTKRCAWCREARPVSEFHRSPTSPDGLGSYCRDCKRETRTPTQPYRQSRRLRKGPTAMDLFYPDRPLRRRRRRLSDDELLALLWRMGGQIHRDEIAYQIRSRAPSRLADPLARLEVVGRVAAEADWWSVTEAGQLYLRRSVA